MTRKEALCAVIGGVVGAVLVMAVGSFAPLGAQSEVADAEFGTITCSKLVVRDNRFSPIAVKTEIDTFGVNVSGKDGRRTTLGFAGVFVSGKEGKGRALVIVGEDGGSVRVFGKDGEGSAQMVINDNGGSVAVRGKDGEGSAKMAINDNGGSVAVHGKGNTDSRAVMGVNEYGNGAVSTWDKNGYRLTTLK